MKIDGKTLGLLFELRDRLEARVAGVPAEQKALPRFMPDGTEVKTLEDVATVLGCDEFVATQYVKAVRRVRTAAGMRRFGLPMNAIIVPGAREFPNYSVVPNTPQARVAPVVEAVTPPATPAPVPPHLRGLGDGTLAEKKKRWKDKHWQSLWNEYYEAKGNLEEHGSDALYKDLKEMLKVLASKTPKAKDRNGKDVSIGDVVSIGKGKGYAEWQIVQVGSDGSLGLRNIGRSDAYLKKRPTRIVQAEDVAFQSKSDRDLDQSRDMGKRNRVEKDGIVGYITSRTQESFGATTFYVHVYAKDGTRVGNSSHTYRDKAKEALDNYMVLAQGFGDFTSRESRSPAALAEKFPIGSRGSFLSVTVGRSETVEGEVVGHRQGGIDVLVPGMGTMVVEPQKFTPVTKTPATPGSTPTPGMLGWVLFPGTARDDVDAFNEAVKDGDLNAAVEAYERIKGKTSTVRYQSGLDQLEKAMADFKADSPDDESDIPEFDTGILIEKDIERLRNLPDSMPTKRVESTHAIFFDQRDLFEELAQSDHPNADLFQEVVDQLDETETAVDGLFEIRDDPSSYDADEKADAREAVRDAFEALADALDELRSTVVAPPAAGLTLGDKEKDGEQVYRTVNNPRYPDTPYYITSDDEGYYSVWYDSEGNENYTDGGYHATEAAAMDALRNWDATLTESVVDAAKPDDLTKMTDAQVDDLVRDLGLLLRTAMKQPRGLSVVAQSPEVRALRQQLGAAKKEQVRRRKPKTAQDRGGSATIFPNPFHGDDTIDPDDYDGFMEGDAEADSTGRTTGGGSTPTPETPKPPKVVRDAPGTRRRRKTDVRPADPVDVPTGKAPAADDPWLRAANDAIYEATKLGVDQSILDDLNRIRERIRTGSTWVGGRYTDVTIRQARAQVRDGSTADVALIKLNDELQNQARPRKWSTVPVKAVSTTSAPPTPPIKRTTKKARILTAKERSQKAALDTSYRKTHRDLINTAKANKAAGGDEMLAAKIEQLSKDLDTMRAQYKKKGWAVPVILRKAGARPKKGGTSLIAWTATEQAEYDALPNDEAKRIYRTARMNGAGHSGAVSKAMEFAPTFAKILQKGRKNRAGNVIKVATTAEGDDYVLRKDSAGNWYATYDEGGVTIDVLGGRYKTEDYALAALERWHLEYYRRLNAGQTKPSLPASSTLTLGRRQTVKAVDYYKVTTNRGREYYLAYDGQGWYSVKYEADGSETSVHDNYFADGTSALKFLEQADIESRRRKPKLPKAPSKRTLTRQTMEKFEKIETPTKGDRLAVDGDGNVIEKPAALVTGVVMYQEVRVVRTYEYQQGTDEWLSPDTARKRDGDMTIPRVRDPKLLEVLNRSRIEDFDQEMNVVVFTDGTFGVLPATMYRVRPTKGLLDSALATTMLLLEEFKELERERSMPNGDRIITIPPSKDVYGGMPGLPATGTRGRIVQRPQTVSRRRRRRALERARGLVQKKAMDDLVAFLDVYEGKGKVRRVRNARGARYYGQPVGSIIKPDAPDMMAPPTSGRGLEAVRKKGSKLPVARNEDGWTIYDVDLLGQKFGITNDGQGWYSYFADNDKFAEPNYYDTPDEALDALVKWTATAKMPRRKIVKVRIGAKEYAQGTRLKAHSTANLPKATRPLGPRSTWKSITTKAEIEKEKARILKEWGMLVPPAWTNLEVNTDHDDDGPLIRGTSPTAADPTKVQTMYSPYHTERQKKANQAKSKRGMAARPALEKAVDKDAVDDDRAGMLALVLYMGLRPDTQSSKSHTQVYGASTLERQHVVWDEQKGQYSLVFPPAKGKGKTITIPVTHPTVIAALDARWDYAPNTQLFAADDKEANAYLKDKMGAEFSMKNLRTMIANEIALAYIANRKPQFTQPKTMRELKAIQLEVATPVSEMLGNKPQQSIDTYIDSGIWDVWEAGITA